MPLPIRPEEPPAIQERALDNLRFIRRAMEDAASFTTAPGWGQVAIGITALVAAVVAARMSRPQNWLATWLIEAGIAVAVGTWTTIRKSRAAGLPAVTAPAQRFAVTFALPMFAGLVLTLVLARSGQFGLLPGVWLLLFGSGIAAGGIFSIPIVRLMGLCFMIEGAAALFAPPAWGDALLALGFGGMLIAFGIVIARRHGG